MPKSNAKSTVRRELVSNQILEGAAALLADRGFASTSMQEVADALEISRTALYHYISGKDELLATLVRGITRETAAELQRIATDRKLDPVARLELAVTGMAERVANRPARFRLLLVTEGSLPEPLAGEHRDARHETLEHLSAIIRRGIKAGALRPVDERIAAFALLGMCNWIAWWYRPERDERAPAVVAGEIADLAVATLRSGDEGATENGDGVDRAVKLLHRDLAFLERSLAEQGSSSTRARKRRR